MPLIGMAASRPVCEQPRGARPARRPAALVPL